jgi:serine/threonine protein kinase
MITPDNTVKIIDLGVAKLDDDTNVSQTRTGIFVGKLRYAAPEQLGFLPEGEKIDGRTDLYALAMVVVELLTGRPPYEAKSPHEYFLHHAKEIPMNTVELPANLPGSDVLQQILQKALSRNRDERFASASEFAAALERIEGTLPDTTSGTVALALDDDATWRPSDSGRETALGTGRTPAPGAAPLAASVAATAIVPPAAETVRTPLPPVGSYAPRKRNPAIAVVAVLALLVVVGGAFAYALWPKITQVISPLTNAISPSATTTQPAVTQTQPPLTQSQASVTPPTNPSQTTMTVTPTVTTSSASMVTASTANPPVSIINSRPPLKTASNQTATQNQAHSDRPAEVIDHSSEARHDEPAHDQPAHAENNADEDEGRSVPARVPSLYVDGPGRHAGNDRALARLRRELRGVHEVILLGGGQQIMVYRALHRSIPSLQFGSDSNVTIQWDATATRLGRERGNLAASATISKDGRVIFRYDLPGGVDSSSAADAFAQTIAEAFSD